MFLQLWRDPHALFEPAEEMYLEGLYVRGMRRCDEVSSFRRDVVTPFCWVFCEARQDELAKREEQRGSTSSPWITLMRSAKNLA